MADRTRNTSKIIILASFCAALVPGVAGAQAPITEVVVYGDRAQVTRSARANCGTGEAVFSGLPSTLEPHTLSAEVSSGEVVGVTHREEASGPQPEAKDIQNKIREIDRKTVQLQNESAVASAASRKLASFEAHLKRVWGRQARGKTPPVGQWTKALDLLRDRARKAMATQLKVQTKLRELRWQRRLLRDDLALIERKRRRTTVRATVHLKCNGKPKVSLHYTVPGATWRMAYQMRADPSRGRVRITARALVQQATGEDWSKVELAVSTANLQRKNVPPDITRMRVEAYKPADTTKVLTRRFEHRKKLKVGSKSGVTQPAPAAGAPDTGLAFRLPAATRVSIPANGRQVDVVLAQKTVTARYVFETVPKLFPFVYRRVEIDNPFNFTLLPGDVELMEGRSFVGRTAMKLRGLGEPFAFTLGVDNQLQVKRYIKKEKLEKAGSFSKNQRLRHRYVLQLGNWSRKTVKLRVKENVPVSRIRAIKVALSADTTKPTSHDKRDGIVTWEVSLSPRAKKNIVLDYSVDVPRTYKVHGYR